MKKLIKCYGHKPLVYARRELRARKPLMMHSRRERGYDVPLRRSGHALFDLAWTRQQARMPVLREIERIRFNRWRRGDTPTYHAAQARCPTPLYTSYN